MIIKTPEEYEILREGGRRLAHHVATLASMAQPGTTPKDLEGAARVMVREDGDELAFLGYGERKGESYPSGLCVSVNDVIVHGPAGENTVPFEQGDVVCIDFGIKHRGLFTDHAVTVIAGDPLNKEDTRLLAGTQEALSAGIAAAKLGNTIGDIGYAVEQIADKYRFGYPKYLSGHGVGRSVHEEPHVPNFGEPGRGEKLVEGLVIAIEPMMTLGSGDLYVDKDGLSYRTKDGSRSAHFEHTVIITKNGPEVITKVR